MSVEMRHVRSSCHRICYAALLTASVWIYARLPLAEGDAPPSQLTTPSTVVRLLDLPIAAASQLVPCRHSGVDLWFRLRCPEPIGSQRMWVLKHMAIGTVAYTLLFLLPVAYRTGRREWRRRKARGGEPAPG